VRAREDKKKGNNLCSVPLFFLSHFLSLSLFLDILLSCLRCDLSEGSKVEVEKQKERAGKEDEGGRGALTQALLRKRVERGLFFSLLFLSRSHPCKAPSSPFIAHRTAGSRVLPWPQESQSRRSRAGSSFRRDSLSRESFSGPRFCPSHVVVLSRRSEGNTVARPQRALERSRDTPGALSRSTRFASRFWFEKE
jgi:hypothetical protein